MGNDELRIELFVLIKQRGNFAVYGRFRRSKECAEPFYVKSSVRWAERGFMDKEIKCHDDANMRDFLVIPFKEGKSVM